MKDKSKDVVVVDPDDPLALIRKKQLAAILDVNPWTIDRWRKLGLIPEPVVLSSQIVAWRRSTISLWLMEKQHAPPAPRQHPTRKVKRAR